MKRMLLAIMAVCLVACTDDVDAQRTLESEGYTNIQFTGYDMFACGKDDSYSSGFNATNALGKRVSGTVCCGFWKKCTVRF